jgi:uncharacterized protein (DUF58 family)
VIPTRRLVLLAVIPLVIGAVSFWVKAAILPMIAVDLVILLVAGLDLLLSGGAVEARRSVAAVQSVGRPFEVCLVLSNLGRRTLRLRVTDDAPGERRGLPISMVLHSYNEAEISYQAEIDQRGEHVFGPVTLRWRSPLGLWERQRALRVPGSIRVYPSFRQLRHYGLKARDDERRIPVRVRRRPGGENEFERLRPYVLGDELRHIDWRATAKKRELITREYGQESNQNLIFMLDCGRMMSARSGSLTAFDHALNAALMMGQVALRHGDRVGLIAFDRRVRAWLSPRGGARSGSRLIRGTYDLFPSLHEPDYALAFRHLAQRVRRRSLVVLMTAVVDEPNATLAKALVRGLAGRHLPLCVWMRDPDLDVLVDRPATRPAHLYQRGAAAELTAWRESGLAALRRRGALVVDATPDRLTPALLGRYLEIKARRLL